MEYSLWYSMPTNGGKSAGRFRPVQSPAAKGHSVLSTHQKGLFKHERKSRWNHTAWLPRVGGWVYGWRARVGIWVGCVGGYGYGILCTGQCAEVPSPKLCFSSTAAAVGSQSHSLRFHSADIHLGQKCQRPAAALPCPWAPCGRQLLVHPMDNIAWTNHQTNLKAWMNYRQNLWTIAGTNHQTRFILWSNTRFLLDKLWEKPLGKYEVSERLPKRYPRGLQEVSEGCPRGCERFCEEVSERSPRGSEEVFKRSPRGFREVSERFRRGIQDPRGFRGVSERLWKVLGGGRERKGGPAWLKMLSPAYTQDWQDISVNRHRQHPTEEYTHTICVDPSLLERPLDLGWPAHFVALKRRGKEERGLYRKRPRTQQARPGRQHQQLY